MFTSCSIQGAESNGLGPRKLKRCLPPLFPIQLVHFHQNWVTAPYYMGICNQNVNKKRRFTLIKAQRTAIGPYVVAFWMLSRLVLVRRSCDAAFGPYSESHTGTSAVMRTPVTWSPCLQATTFTAFLSLELNL